MRQLLNRLLRGSKPVGRVVLTMCLTATASAGAGEYAVPVLASPAPAPVDLEITVLSLNIKGLPFASDPAARLAEIGNRLASERAAGTAPDFVLLQEGFIDATEKALIQRAGYPYVSAGPGGSKIFGSGLYLLSEYPPLDSLTLLYDDCGTFDCFASKGLQAVRFQLPGIAAPVYVVNTHLQAESEYDRVRISQIDQVARFFHANQINQSLNIFAGDFNFKPRHPSFTHFRQKMPHQEAGSFCLSFSLVCQIETGPPATRRHVWVQTHDRHFYFNPVESSVRVTPVRLARNFTEPFRQDYLSDHWGYQVTYRIQSSGPEDGQMASD